jgi:hypothetical protein
MNLSNGYTLGVIGTTFVLWNEKNIITLESKTLQHAIKESQTILKQNERINKIS